MISEYQIRVLPRIAAGNNEIKKFIAEEKGISLKSISAIRIYRNKVEL